MVPSFPRCGTVFALQVSINLPFCFTSKPCKEVGKCRPHLTLVTALSTTLQIASRATTYGFCFEHFPSIARSFSQCNIQRPKASACQKSFFLFFFSLVCNVIFIKVCQELRRGSSPLVALCFVVCGLKTAFIRENVTKISSRTPWSSVLSYQYVPGNIGTAGVFLM